MAEYLDIEQASKRLGKSTKTLRRWVYMQKIPYRMDNRKLYFDVADLEAKRTEESPDKLDNLALLERIEGMESSLQSISERLAALEVQMTTAPLPAIPRPSRSETMSEDGVNLYDFADLHGISRNEALSRWRTGMIAGSNRGTSRRPIIVIAGKGRRDFFVQFHDTPGFKVCDSCPHQS